MYNIAIVDDESIHLNKLEKQLKTYGSKNNITFNIEKYNDGNMLLKQDTTKFDIIFFDIMMPTINGMEAAEKIRKINLEVKIIFMTNFSQYALKGYDVAASAYIMKEDSYTVFALKLSKVLRNISKRNNIDYFIKTNEKIIKLSLNKIVYIESDNHHVIFHTVDNSYKQYTTLKSVENQIKSYGFSRCNNCYLVNLSLIENIKGYKLSIAGIELQISQQRKKTFLQETYGI